MDYLVFGVGFGSSLVLVGWLLRQYGPLLRFRASADDVLSAEQLLERNDWQRFCVALGALLSVSGAVMLLATLVTMLIHPSDSVGTIIVGIIFSLSLIAVAAWIVMYVNQHRALAGDRRVEAIATTRTTQVRKAAAPAPAPAPEKSVDDRKQPTEPAAPATPTMDQTAQKRAARQPQTAAETSSQPEASVAGRASQPQETQRSADPQRPSRETTARAARPQAPVAAPASSRESRSEPPAAEPQTGDSTPSLRNLQFKRTTANRAQHERHAAPTRPAAAENATPDEHA